MASLNQFIIAGNLTKDVVLRFTPAGQPVTTYSIAINNVYFVEGVKHEEADYIPVTTYGKQAENDAKYLKKGSSVLVTGRMRSWYKPEDKKGGINFEAFKVQYLGSPSKSKPGNESSSSEAGEQSSSFVDDDFVRDMEKAEQEMQEKTNRAAMHRK